MALLKLSAPWQTYYKELCTLFGQDEEIHIVFDEENYCIMIYVDNDAKADALYYLIPDSRNYGGIELAIEVIPSNDTNSRNSRGSIIEDAFYGNPIVNKIKEVDYFLSNSITYVIFKKEVVQYFNDDLGDAFGMCSTLYEDIARRVLSEVENVYYCTDTVSNSLLSTRATCLPSSITYN